MDKKKVNVCFLKGNLFQRKEILQKIKNSFETFELSIYDKSSSYKYVEQKILEYSCFSENRIIILNELPSSSQTRTTVLNHLKKLLLIIPSDCLLILNNLDISSKSFLSVVNKIGKVFEFDQIIDREAAKKYIFKYFKDKDKKIEIKNVDIIVESISFGDKKIDLDKLFLLLDKMNQYVGRKKDIKKEDVIAVCSHSNDFIIWDLFNKLDEKNICRSLLLVNNVVSVIEKIEEEVSRIINLMLWRYKLLLYSKGYAVKNVKIEEISQNISNLNKLERKGKDFRIITNKKKDKEGNVIHAYSKKNIESLFRSYYGRKPTIQCYTEDELLLINYTLYQSLLKIRSGCTISEIVILLELICMVICGKIKNLSHLDILKNKNTLLI